MADEPKMAKPEDQKEPNKSKITIGDRSYLYTGSPRAYLNSSRKSQDPMGDALQAFFDVNGIDINLITGLGSDKDNLYSNYTTVDRGGKASRQTANLVLTSIFEDTDFSTGAGFASLKAGSRSELMRSSLGLSPLTTHLLLYCQGEDSPRFIYYDREKKAVRATAMVKDMRAEDLKPHKPNWWKQLWHAVNSNLYKKDFDDYESDMELYPAFEETLNSTKPLAEAEAVERAAAQAAPKEEYQKEVMAKAGDNFPLQEVGVEAITSMQKLQNYSSGKEQLSPEQVTIALARITAFNLASQNPCPLPGYVLSRTPNSIAPALAESEAFKNAVAPDGRIRADFIQEFISTKGMNLQEKFSSLAEGAYPKEQKPEANDPQAEKKKDLNKEEKKEIKIDNLGL